LGSASGCGVQVQADWTKAVLPPKERGLQWTNENAQEQFKRDHLVAFVIPPLTKATASEVVRSKLLGGQHQ